MVRYVLGSNEVVTKVCQGGEGIMGLAKGLNCLERRFSISENYSKQKLWHLIDGQLPWDRVHEIIKNPKEKDRLEKVGDIYQGKVAFKDLKGGEDEYDGQCQSSDMVCLVRSGHGGDLPFFLGNTRP